MSKELKTRSKLTKEDYEEILSKSKTNTNRELAKEYNVTAKYIKMILDRFQNLDVTNYSEEAFKE